MLSQVGDTCRFCQMLNELAGEKSEICQYWHQHGGKQAAELDEDYIYACPAGMILFAVGLNWDGKYQGSVLAGPILIEYPDITFVDDTLLRLNLPPTGRTALFSALGSVTIVDPKRAKYLSQLLYMLLEHDFSRNNSRKQEQGEQQARISEYLQAIDFTYEDGAGQYELDSELQLYIQLEILRSHIIAYVALLSRWAVEAGANAEEMYRLTNKGLKQLVDVSSHDQISLITGVNPGKYRSERTSTSTSKEHSDIDGN